MTRSELIAASKRWLIHGLYYTGLLGTLALLRHRRSRGLLILMYHGIGKGKFMRPSLCVSEKNFDQHVRHLVRHYRVLPLGKAVDLLERGDPLPNHSVALTFDDGYRDNYEKAFPILKKYGCPATIFVASEPLRTGRSLWPTKLYFWFKTTKATELRLRLGNAEEGKLGGENVNVFDLRTKRDEATLDRIEFSLRRLDPLSRDSLLTEISEDLGFTQDTDPLDEVPMLTWDQLREMARAGITIGSHTMTHPVLTTMSSQDAMRELAESKTILEREVGQPIAFFAYPFGGHEHFNSEIQALVKQAGYRAAFTAVNGFNHRDTNRFALRRMHVGDDRPSIFAFKLLCASGHSIHK